MIQTAMQPPVNVFYGVNQTSPVGPLLLGVTAEGALCRIAFAALRNEATILKAWRAEWPNATFQEKKSVASLRFPYDGKVLLVGTPFRHKVWKELLKIKPGKPISYAEMAQRIGKPGAARAVGGALRANPVPYVVPCHRVIAADGTPGGFAGSRGALTVGIKEKLLAAEGTCRKKKRENKRLLPSAVMERRQSRQSKSALAPFRMKAVR